MVPFAAVIPARYASTRFPGKPLADLAGKPWDPKRGGIRWDGTRWVGIDVPDIAPTLGPDSGAGPFIMTNEGVARLFAPALNEGPFPEHYEPFETPIGTNPLHPKVVSNPVARVFKGDMESFGKSDLFPYAATTYRLTEHHLSGVMSRWLPWLAELQPALFVERRPALAGEKGIANTEVVRVITPRAEITAKALVTRRMRPMTVAGKTIHHVGLPWHWGYAGIVPGDIANDLTASVGDANSHIPETKVFLCNIKRKNRA